MKTRSNMPLYVLEVSNVKTLSNAQIDLLRCGDYLVKKDASGEHAYKVTFKSDTGMCITYHDASVIETQSYDKIDGVWTYNSEDKTENLLDVATKTDIESGTLANAKPIYWHGIEVFNNTYTDYVSCHILNNSPTKFTSWTQIENLMKSTAERFTLQCDGIVTINNVAYPLLAIFKRINEYTINLVVYDESTHKWSVISNVSLSFSDCIDGVNKIN